MNDGYADESTAECALCGAPMPGGYGAAGKYCSWDCKEADSDN